MSTKLEEFKKKQKKELPEINPGDRVKVYQKVKAGDDERVQAFEGLVIARKHGEDTSATITVRNIIEKVGVEKIFPIHSPTIEKIEIIKRGNARKAKLYYVRDKSRKAIRRKLRAKN